MIKSKLKIAIYSGDIPSTTFIERLIKSLSKTDNQIYLFGFLKSKVSYNHSVKVISYKNTKWGKGMHLLKYAILLSVFKYKEKKKLDHILKARSKNLLLAKVKCYPVLWCKPDIFHLQWAKGVADWVWVKEFNIKLVLSLRGAHINYSPIANMNLAKMYSDYFSKVDAFHAVSKAIAKESKKYNAAEDKIKVIYSGLDIEANAAIKNKTENIFQIISIGRPHWVKGYVYALDACKMLKDRGFKFKYIIIGGANDVEYAYQLKDLNLEDEVELLESVSFSQVKSYMLTSNLLLLPSVKEGVPNVVLEAMTLKVPVLSTNCGGVSEVIIDGENGFLAPIRNAEAIAAKVIEISNLTQEKLDNVLLNASKTVKDNHNEKQMVESMLKLYKNL